MPVICMHFFLDSNKPSSHSIYSLIKSRKLSDYNQLTSIYVQLHLHNLNFIQAHDDFFLGDNRLGRNSILEYEIISLLQKIAFRKKWSTNVTFDYEKSLLLQWIRDRPYKSVDPSEEW